jgi:peptidoglycan hydrolase-like protein with peptidoglycan-binding domain
VTTRGTLDCRLVLAMLVALAATAGACSSAPATTGATGATDVDAPSPTAEPTTTTASPTTTAAPTTTTTAPATTTTVPPTTAPPTTVPPAPPGLRPGAEGPEVVALQTSLTALGYWLGEADGRYAHLTEQAVMAFQKANGLARDGIAGPQTLHALATATRPTPRVVTDGIEIDLEHQVLLVVQGGQVTIALNTSTGRSGWRTPPGGFAIYREIDGMRHAPLGDLWRPKYFHGGIAVHGATSIPAQPASHGCARVSFAAMDMLWGAGLAEVGTRVVVY